MLHAQTSANAPHSLFYRLPFKNKKGVKTNLKKGITDTFGIMKTKKMVWLYIPFLFGGT